MRYELTKQCVKITWTGWLPLEDTQTIGAYHTIAEAKEALKAELKNEIHPYDLDDFMYKEVYVYDILELDEISEDNEYTVVIYAYEEKV